MRDRGDRNGIRANAYAGTTGVLLAMNVTLERRKDLLGFAIERSGPYNGERWLKGLVQFPGHEGVYLDPIETCKAPIQKFRWSDYSIYPNTHYTYRVNCAYGPTSKPTLVKGAILEVKTEPLHSGAHQVIFNRACAASQAYTRKFGKTNPDKPGNEAAQRWLSRGLKERIISFLEKATCDKWALDMAIYEIDLEDIVEHLQDARDRGVKVRIVYHGRKKDKRTKQNEDCLDPIKDVDVVPRRTSKIFHQKFIVLSYIGPGDHRHPVSVLTGTTNFTPNGVYRQANVVHIADVPDLAEEYLRLFDLLHSGVDTRGTKQYISNKNPVVEGPLQVIFSPRKGFGDIKEVCKAIEGAKKDLIFCTAFKLHDDVLAALVPVGEDEVVRYGLQNRKSGITGTHRFGTYTVPTFLRGDGKDFLEESTAGQKGSIYVHLKTMVTDFTTDNPTIIFGSNNFSVAGSKSNDENMVILKGETSVADTYVCEMMRHYDHYRFRYNRFLKKKAGGGPPKKLELSTDDSWTNKYFERGSIYSLERNRFCR